MADPQRHTFRDHDNVPGVCWRMIDGTNNVCGRGPDDDVHQPAADAQRPATGGEQDGRACRCCTEPMGNDTGDVCSFCQAWGCGADVRRG